LSERALNYKRNQKEINVAPCRSWWGKGSEKPLVNIRYRHRANICSIQYSLWAVPLSAACPFTDVFFRVSP